MDDKALRDYIQKEVERGFTRTEIKEALLDVGYSGEEIESCFKEMSNNNNVYSILKKEALDSSVKRYFYYVLISIAILAIGVYFLVFVDYSGFNPFDPNNDSVKSNDSQGFFTPSIKDQLKDRENPVNNLKDIVGFGGSENTEKGEPDRFYSKVSQEQLDCIYENDVSSKMCKAIVLEDNSICDGIKKSNERKSCQDMVVLKESLTNTGKCSEMNILPDMLCEVVVTENTEACEKLSSDTLKKTCKDLISLKKGVETKDSSICETSDSVDKALCLAMTKDDMSYCNSILSRIC